MNSYDNRLDHLEKRLSFLEKKLGLAAGEILDIQTQVPPTGAPPTSPREQPREQTIIMKKQIQMAAIELNNSEPISATKMMAWCAGITFVLAITYFLNLIYASGWLTPVRQLFLAYTASISLIVTGLWLKNHDKQYFSYLPAVGLVGLYLTTLAGNIHYQLLDQLVATVLIGMITLAGIWLGRKFDNSVYPIFSAIGVYVTPLILNSHYSNLVDLVIYYSAWSLLFSFCAIHEGRRITYLIPMYLAILGFDMVSRNSTYGDWVLTVNFQLIQFVIFSLTTVLFTIRYDKPLSQNDAISHALALWLFYGIEYSLLRDNIPQLVNYIAMLSAGFVYAAYAIAKRYVKDVNSIENGAMVVSAYCSWVAFHAGFLGVVSEAWLPWATLLTPMIFWFALNSLAQNKKVFYPIAIACGSLFVLGYSNLIFPALASGTTETPMPTVALFIYSAMLYVMYFQFSRSDHGNNNAVIALYAGHLGVIGCTINLVTQNMFLSGVWAMYALIMLAIAMRLGNKTIGQSALLLFAVAGLKVWWLDLSDSNSMIRVVVLLVLSASLYAGGWLYQALVRRIDD